MDTIFVWLGDETKKSFMVKKTRFYFEVVSEERGATGGEGLVVVRREVEERSEVVAVTEVEEGRGAVGNDTVGKGGGGGGGDTDADGGDGGMSTPAAAAAAVAVVDGGDEDKGWKNKGVARNGDEGLKMP